MKKLIITLMILLLVALTACEGSAPPATAEASSQLAVTPAAPAEVTASALPPAEIPSSKFLRFGQLTTEDGLSNDQVRGIAQDSHGFMWITTFDGLNRYDGSSVKVYRHDPDDPNSLSNNTVRIPIVDQNGILWFGTFGGGLNQYDIEKDVFIRYQHDPDNPHSLSNDIIRAVYEDQVGTIWVGTNVGLNKLNRDSKQFTRYLHDPDNPNSLSNNVVLSIFEDITRVLWFGTEDGLNRFDPITEQFIHYRHDPDDPTSLSDSTINTIREDSSGLLWIATNLGLCKLNPERTRFTCYQHDATDPQTISNNAAYGLHIDQTDDIWVGTWGGGLNRFDRSTESFIHYEHRPTDPYSLNSNNVDQIYEDRQGMLWISTDGGISTLDGGGKLFHHIRSIPDDPDSLSNDEVRSLYVDQAGVTWIGSNGGGLSQFDPRTEQFLHYLHDPDEPNSLMGDAVWTIYEDQEGMMWVGSYGFGLSKFNPDSEQFTHYQYDPGDPLSLSNNAVTSILEDRHGRFWIGTENGLNEFDGDTFTRYEHDTDDPQSLSSSLIVIVFEDRSGQLWIGTANGLDKFSAEEGTFTRYNHDPADPQSLGNNTVVSMVEDQTGNLWIGTLGGLDKFDRENDRFTHYTTKDGLSSDAVFGILEDEQGLLWLSTANGLSRFDPQTESFRNYDVSDGLQSDSFLFYSSYAKNQNGELFFGGTNGFNAFYPDQIVDNLVPPPVMITDFQLANQPVPIGGDSVLQKSILETDELLLSYLDNVFSFEFAALNFQVPEKNRFRYKMEGFEEDWNEVDGTRRFATYTNLDPGDYVFRVMASNNDGVWNDEGDSVKITITPPWWETIWFRLGLGILVIGMLAGGYFWRMRSVEVRSRELEAQIRLLFENSPLGIALSTYGGQFLTVNNALPDMLRISEEELLKQGVSDFYVDPADRKTLLAELQASGSVNDFGIQLRRYDGSTFFGSVNMSRLLLEGDEVLLTMVEDVTDQITAEQQAATLEERERLARELHDSVTQTLFSASVLAQASPRMVDKDPAIGKRNFEQLALLINGALAEMRTLLLELRPNRLKESNLPELISLLVESTRARTRAVVSLNVEGSCSPPEDVAIALYRIAQEALNNISKHAMASEIVVDLNCESDGVKLSIKDDGKGFDPQVIPAGHFGINIMRERAQKIDAPIEIKSEVGGGTQINVSWSELGNEHE